MADQFTITLENSSIERGNATIDETLQESIILDRSEPWEVSVKSINYSGLQVNDVMKALSVQDRTLFLYFRNKFNQEEVPKLITLDSDASYNSPLDIVDQLNKGASELTPLETELSYDDTFLLKDLFYFQYTQSDLKRGNSMTLIRKPQSRSNVFWNQVFGDNITAEYRAVRQPDISLPGGGSYESPVYDTYVTIKFRDPTMDEFMQDFVIHHEINTLDIIQNDFNFTEGATEDGLRADVHAYDSLYNNYFLDVPQRHNKQINILLYGARTEIAEGDIKVPGYILNQWYKHIAPSYKVLDLISAINTLTDSSGMIYGFDVILHEQYQSLFPKLEIVLSDIKRTGPHDGINPTQLEYLIEVRLLNTAGEVYWSQSLMRNDGVFYLQYPITDQAHYDFMVYYNKKILWDFLVPVWPHWESLQHYPNYSTHTELPIDDLLSFSYDESISKISVSFEKNPYLLQGGLIFATPALNYILGLQNVSYGPLYIQPLPGGESVGMSTEPLMWHRKIFLVEENRPFEERIKLKVGSTYFTLHSNLVNGRHVGTQTKGHDVLLTHLPTFSQWKESDFSLQIIKDIPHEKRFWVPLNTNHLSRIKLFLRQELSNRPVVFMEGGSSFAVVLDIRKKPNGYRVGLNTKAYKSMEVYDK